MSMTTAPQSSREIAEAIRRAWSFDDGQRHTHSWHDREDFLDKKLPGLLDSLVAAKVSEEREACAQLAWNDRQYYKNGGRLAEAGACDLLAGAIRARGQP